MYCFKTLLWKANYFSNTLSLYDFEFLYFSCQNTDQASDSNSCLKIFWNFLLFLAFPIRMVVLYYSDILSDLFQTVNFYNNCHIRYFSVSLGIIISSYIITAVFVKLTSKWSWLQSLCFHWNCR